MPPLMQLMSDIVLRSTIVLAIAGIAALIMRRSSAAARHAVWAAALAGILFIPFAILLPGWHILPARQTQAVPQQLPPSHAEQVTLPMAVSELPIPPAPAETETLAAEISKHPAEAGPAQQNASPNIRANGHVLSTAGGASLSTWLALLWMTGSTILLFPALLALITLRRIKNGSTCITTRDALSMLQQTKQNLAIARDIRLETSESCHVPMTFGLRRPRIVVPPNHQSWPQVLWRMILTHECAHIRRFDIATLWLGQLARAIFWFHPLVWFAHARLAIESEKACDDIVLAAGTEPQTYASALVDMAAANKRGLTSQIVLHMARQSSLEARVRGVLDSNCRRGAASLWALCCVISLLAAAATVGLSRAAVPGPSIAATSLPTTNPAADHSARDAFNELAKLGAVIAEKLETQPASAVPLQRRHTLMEWERRVLADRLAAATSPNERRDALDAYGERLRKQWPKAEDGVIGASAMAQYANAELEGLNAGMRLRIDALGPPEVLAAGPQREAGKKLAHEAAALANELDKLADLRMLTPEFVAMRAFWIRRSRDAQLMITDDPARRVEIAAETLQITKRIAQEVSVRREIDATFATICLAHLAEAEAGHVHRVLDAQAKGFHWSPTPVTPELSRMTIECAALNQGLQQLEKVRALTPEFLNLILDHQRRFAQLTLIDNPPENRLGNVGYYEKQLRGYLDKVEAQGDPGDLLGRMIQYYQVEAKNLPRFVGALLPLSNSTRPATTTAPAAVMSPLPSVRNPAVPATGGVQRPPTSENTRRNHQPEAQELSAAEISAMLAIAKLQAEDKSQIAAETAILEAHKNRLSRLLSQGNAVTASELEDSRLDVMVAQTRVDVAKAKQQELAVRYQQMKLLADKGEGLSALLPQPPAKQMSMEEAKAKLAIAELRASNNAVLKAEQAVYAQKQRRLETLKRMGASISVNELQDAELDLLVTGARVELAKHQREEDLLQLDLARQQLESVRRAASRQRTVSLLGAVEKPGTYNILDESQTIAQTISIAGVKADSFATLRITLVRNDREGKSQQSHYNMADLVKPGAVPLIVQDRDVILVEIIEKPGAAVDDLLAPGSL